MEVMTDVLVGWVQMGRYPSCFISKAVARARSATGRLTKIVGHRRTPPRPTISGTLVAGCVLRSAAFNRCAHTVRSGYRLARRGAYLLIFLSYSFGPPLLQQAITDRPSEAGSHARTLLPDPRGGVVAEYLLNSSVVAADIRRSIINEQHTTVKVPIDHGLKVRDIVALSPSHPFTTFDKWRLIWELDDDYKC
jgi:hypothetical protein